MSDLPRLTTSALLTLNIADCFAALEAHERGEFQLSPEYMEKVFATIREHVDEIPYFESFIEAQVAIRETEIKRLKAMVKAGRRLLTEHMKQTETLELYGNVRRVLLKRKETIVMTNDPTQRDWVKFPLAVDPIVNEWRDERPEKDLIKKLMRYVRFAFRDELTPARASMLREAFTRRLHGSRFKWRAKEMSKILKDTPDAVAADRYQKRVTDFIEVGLRPNVKGTKSKSKRGAGKKEHSDSPVALGDAQRADSQRAAEAHDAGAHDASGADLFADQ